jgi:hypothetical protein
MTVGHAAIAGVAEKYLPRSVQKDTLLLQNHAVCYLRTCCTKQLDDEKASA